MASNVETEDTQTPPTLLGNHLHKLCDQLLRRAKTREDPNVLLVMEEREKLNRLMDMLRKIADNLDDSSPDYIVVRRYRSMLGRLAENVDAVIHALNIKGVATSGVIKAIQSPYDKLLKVIDNLKSVDHKWIFFSIIQEWMPQIPENISTETKIEQSSQPLEMVTAEWSTKIATVAEKEWTIQEPDISHGYDDDDEDTWYSFLCMPGKFECSISGLRWTCKNMPLRFKYRFGKWSEHTDRVEVLQYVPAGPLLDITVIYGRFDEVYLPHWICTTVDPTILGKFAVLHSDINGVIVEEVSEVTPSHVKLPYPLFSRKGIVLRLKWIWRRVGFRVSLKCKVLIYRTKKTFLTLHVYVIPNHPALEAELNKKAVNKGYERIEKPHPEGTLQLDDQLKLNIDGNSAEIMPNKYRFRYDGRDPNYFEVFIEEPEDHFTLQLQNAVGTVWSCAIRQFDYSISAPQVRRYDEDLLKVRTDFAYRVNEEIIDQLLDYLLDVVLNDGEIDAIRGKNRTARNQARALIDTVRMKGPEASKTMIYYFERRDPKLHKLLGLPSLPTP